MEKRDTIRGTLVFSSSISATEAIKKHRISLNRVQSRNIARALREDIMRSEYTPLPENIKIEDITNGEVTFPESVKEFFQFLISGPDTRVWKSNSKKEKSIFTYTRCYL